MQQLVDTRFVFEVSVVLHTQEHRVDSYQCDDKPVKILGGNQFSNFVPYF